MACNPKRIRGPEMPQPEPRGCTIIPDPHRAADKNIRTTNFRHRPLRSARIGRRARRSAAGQMHFDDERVRRDGLFVTDDLMPLNPDALK